MQLIIKVYVNDCSLGDNSLYTLVDYWGYENMPMYLDSGYVLNLPGTNNRFWAKYIASYDTNGNRKWLDLFDNMSPDARFFPKIKALKNDELLSYGVFMDTVDFNPDPLQEMYAYSSTNVFGGYPNLSYFITKLDSSGNLLWYRQLEAFNSIDMNNAIDDAQGNIYITGRFSGTVDFDPDTSASYALTAPLVTAPGLIVGDIVHYSTASFCLKLDANGNFLWAKIIPTPFQVAEDYKNHNNLFFYNDGNLGIRGIQALQLPVGAGAGPGVAGSFLVKIDPASGTEISRMRMDTTIAQSLYLPTGKMLMYGYVSQPPAKIDLNLSPNNAVFLPKKSLEFVACYGTFGVSTHAPLVAGTSIYPTPATHELVVERSAGSPPALATLYDLWGRVVLATTLMQPRSQLGVGELPSGFYVLRIAGEGRSYKVVVQH